jgi:hypothetical protein
MPGLAAEPSAGTPDEKPDKMFVYQAVGQEHREAERAFDSNQRSPRQIARI